MFNYILHTNLTKKSIIYFTLKYVFVARLYSNHVSIQAPICIFKLYFYIKIELSNATIWLNKSTKSYMGSHVCSQICAHLTRVEQFQTQ